MHVQKISTLSPQKELEFPGGWGFCKTKKYKEVCEALLEFPEGWWGLRENPFCGRGMDIFWNYTMKVDFLGVTKEKMGRLYFVGGCGRGGCFLKGQCKVQTADCRLQTF